MSDHIPIPSERPWTPEEREIFDLREELKQARAEVINAQSIAADKIAEGR